MEWNKIICNTRLGCESFANDEDRNSYYRDFDRIIFSKEFRMLQAKTQVVPFPELDATHTRLTHSLETFSVGRSLGIKAAKQLSLEKRFGILPDDVGSIVGAACLCHDIGNPPLGHSGEAAISQYFLEDKTVEFVNSKITRDQLFDFQHFEGNAMGFHLLTNSDSEKTDSKGGLRLTYSTLGAFAKYPNRNTKPKSEKGILPCLKKPGLLMADVLYFEKIAQNMEMKKIDKDSWARHPLAYLTEAADDICYTIVDLEDGFRNGSVSFSETKEILERITLCDKNTTLTSYKDIKDKSEQIGYLRAKSINALINMCIDVFVENEDKILSGVFEGTLINSISGEFTKVLDRISDVEVNKIYTHRNILLTESAGFVVLPGLLDIFVQAAFGENTRSKLLRNGLLKGIVCNDDTISYEEKNYKTLLNISKSIALMTDKYAVKLYRELTGIQLPNY